MIKIGQYHKIRCPICYGNIEVDYAIERCPACKEFIQDKLSASGGGTGITTAVTSGPNQKPIGKDSTQIVY